MLYHDLIDISGAQEYGTDLAVITLALALKGDILAYDQVIQGISSLGTIPLLDFWGIDARQSDLIALASGQCIPREPDRLGLHGQNRLRVSAARTVIGPVAVFSL